MKLFHVQITVDVVVQAANEIDAMQACRHMPWFDLADLPQEIDTLDELRGLDELPSGYSGDDSAINDNDGTALKELLPEIAPVRDTRTLDLFAGVAE